MANDTTHCVGCGAPLTSDPPQGLCPGCLLRRGLEQSLDATPTLVEATKIDIGEARPSATAPPRAGDRLGDYQLIRLLGQGGMGTVYEAEHVESGRRVALKVLSHSLDSDRARQRFLTEARLAASVNHVNSVYVYGAVEIAGVPIIVMELVGGGTLLDRVATGGSMDAPEAVGAVLQVIAGLEAAAAKGILHRDVKPSNCFTEPDGTIKIGDYGLSISSTKLTVARSNAKADTGWLISTQPLVGVNLFQVGFMELFCNSLSCHVKSSTGWLHVHLVDWRPPTAPRACVR